MKTFVLSFVLFAFCAALPGQTIRLVNPSFEDAPRPGRAPEGWLDCGFKGETPPDIQPDPTFSVYKEPFDGETYLGLVVRDNNTWESVGQPLTTPLLKGQCYAFTLQLARSETYISVSRTTSETANYTTPTILRIWGGNGYCNKEELLAVSGIVLNHRWEKNRFILKPSQDWDYIYLEAYFVENHKFVYNGNILIDNASDLTPIDCELANSDSLDVTLNQSDRPSTPSILPAESIPTNIPDWDIISPESIEEMEKMITDNLPLIDFNGRETNIYRTHYVAQIAEAIKTFPDNLYILSVKKDVHDYKVNQLRTAFQHYGVSEELLTVRIMNEADAEREWTAKGLVNGLMLRYTSND